jgi:hypothetical protein
LKNIIYFITFFSFLIFSSTAFQSCRKTNQLPTWDVDNAFPLFYTTLSLTSFDENNVLQSDSTNLLHLVLENTKYQLKLDTIVTIPDTTVFKRIENMFIFAFVPGYPITLRQNELTQLNLKETLLKKLIVKTGTFEVEIKSSLNKPTILHYELSSANLNGEIFKISEPIPAGSMTAPTLFQKTYELDNYTFDLTGTNNDLYNTLVSTIKAEIDSETDTLRTSFTDYIEISLKLKNITLTYAEGYFGSYEFQLPTFSEKINELDIIQNGSLKIEEFHLKATIQNYVGAELQTTIKNISGNGLDASVTSLIHPKINSPINISRATKNGVFAANPVKPSSYPLVFNESNSNLSSIMEKIPTSFNYDMFFKINPLGNVSLSNDFLFTDYGIDVDFEAYVPLKIGAHQFSLSDTIIFTVNDTLPNIGLNDGKLILYGTNHFPFDAYPSLYFIDEYNQVIDSAFFDNQYFKHGKLNNENMVTEGFESKIETPVDVEKINNLYLAKKILVKIIFNTPQYPEVYPVFNYYNIQLKAVAEINQTIPFN